MARNPNKLEKLQRASAFQPQQQYDEEGGHRDDWARGSRYDREFEPGRSGANFSNPSGRPDPDRGYGQDSRYSEWSRGARQFDSSGYGSQGRYSNHGYFGGSGAEYRGTRERDAATTGAATETTTPTTPKAAIGPAPRARAPTSPATGRANRFPANRCMAAPATMAARPATRAAAA